MSAFCRRWRRIGAIRVLVVFVLMLTVALFGPAEESSAQTGSPDTATITASISGRVLDEDGGPVAGIQVNATRSGQTRMGVTDDNGAYRIDYLSTGTYTLQFVDPESRYAAIYYRNAYTADAAEAVAVAGQDRDGFDVVLARGATISGTVELANGADFSSGTVSALRQSGVAYSLSTTFSAEDADGERATYELSSLPAGDYLVTVSARDVHGNHYYEVYDDAESVAMGELLALAPADVRTGIDFRLGDDGPWGEIGGRVTAASGAALPGIQVTAYISQTYSDSSWWSSVRTTHSITDGRYLFPLLPAGLYAVELRDFSRVYLAQYYNGAASLETAQPLDLSAGARLTAVNPVMQMPGVITGTVTVTNDNAPPCVEMLAERTTDAVSRSASACSSERTKPYVIDGLSPGDYYVSARINDLVEYYDDSLSQNAATAVSVAVASTTAGIDIELGTNPGYGAISGRVTSEEGIALADVAVRAISITQTPTFLQSARTAEDGSYRLGSLVPATYTLYFDPRNEMFEAQYYAGTIHAEEAQPLIVTSGGEVANVNATLVRSSGILSGTVRAYDGRILDRGTLTLYRRQDGQWQAVASIYGSTGLEPLDEFAWFGLPAGTYRLGLTGSIDGHSFQQTFSRVIELAEKGAVTDIVLRSDDPADARIAGVVAQADVFLQDFPVELYMGYGSTPLVTVKTDAGGRFVIDGLPAGRYRICVGSMVPFADYSCYPGVGSLADAHEIVLQDGQQLDDLRIEHGLYDSWIYLPLVIDD